MLSEQLWHGIVREMGGDRVLILTDRACYCEIDHRAVILLALDPHDLEASRQLDLSVDKSWIHTANALRVEIQLCPKDIPPCELCAAEKIGRAFRFAYERKCQKTD